MKGDIQMVNTLTKRCSISLIPGTYKPKPQCDIAIRTPIKMAKMQVKKASVAKDVEQMELSHMLLVRF